MKDGNHMEYIYESERIGFVELEEKYKLDYIRMYLDEKIQKKIFKKIYNKEQISNWVEKLINENNNNYVMIEKGSDLFLGNIELVIKNDIAELMLSIVPNMQNQHYGTEAIKATLDFCKEKFNIEKYELFVYKNNLNAIRCYENIGFKIDGNGISQDDVHMKL